jgi:5-methylcytosine-specific restriction endonuclease McrA
MKRTALARVTPLTARQGLSRKTPLRAAGIGRASQNRAAREPGTTNRKPGTRNGTDPTAKTRNAVYRRDGWRCVCCGQPTEGRPHSVGHRKRRSQGGSNEAANLLTFLGWGNGLTGDDDHHWRIDQRRDARDEDKGLTVRSFNDPALVRVTYWDGRVAFLTAAGGLIYEAGAA